jgi:hypothetical protein
VVVFDVDFDERFFDETRVCYFKVPSMVAVFVVSVLYSRPSSVVWL